MTHTSSQDITRLPQTVRDFISRSGLPLNPVAWKTTYLYPQDANAFKPVKTKWHYFILQDGHQLSFLTRHQPNKQGTVYEIAPREGQGAPRPAAERRVLRRVKPQIIEQTPFRSHDDDQEPEHFAAFQYWYPDGVTPCAVAYRITSGDASFEGQQSQTGKLPLREPETVHYALGNAPSDEQWQTARQHLSQALDHLTEQFPSLGAPEPLPAKVQALHLLNTAVVVPGDADTLSDELFHDGYPCQPLLATAAEAWEQHHQRCDTFVTYVCQNLPVDKANLVQHLGESLGLQLPAMATIASVLFDLVYVLDAPDVAQPLTEYAEQQAYDNPLEWTKEITLTALLCTKATPRSETQPGNRLPTYAALKTLGTSLAQIAELHRQQNTAQTVTEAHSQELRFTVPVPDLPPNWAYTPAKNLSTPKKILRLGIFFDGTGQNRYVDEADPEKDISNPVKLHDRYLEEEMTSPYEVVTTRRIYVPGIGTVTGNEAVDGFKAETDLWGLALGAGPEGGVARIKFALQQMSDRIRSGDFDEVVFDLFGFSRGASLARHFTNLVNHWPSSYEFATAFPQHITGRVAFVGLFDTVGSFYWPGNDNEGLFNLNLNEHSAERVVHLTAQNEVRANFPGTLISDERGRLPSNFTELDYPGVHTDIGGGYQDPEHGKHAINYGDWRNFFRIVKTHSNAGMEPRRLMQLQEHLDDRKAPYVMEGAVLHELAHVYKGLSIIPLLKMYELARDFGVPLGDLPSGDARYIVPPGVNRAYERWQTDGRGIFADAPKYLADCLHDSVRFSAAHHAGLRHNTRVWFPSSPQLAITPRRSREQA